MPTSKNLKFKFILIRVDLFLSFCVNNFFFQISDDEFGERSVSVSLDGVESEIVFIDHTSGEMSVSVIHY